MKWLADFIRNPADVIADGDEYAIELHKKYKMIMPGFENLSNKEMTGILSYIHSNNVRGVVRPAAAKDALQDPIKEKIGFSGITIAEKTLAQLPASSADRPLARVSKVASIPHTNQLFALDMRGTLYELKDGDTKVFLDLESKVPHFMESPGMGSGFGSFAFHPDYKNNGLLYTAHSERPGVKKADFGFDKKHPHPRNFNDPIARYDHDDGNAIAGGFEYKGKKMPSLYNKFLFGDIVNGRLFTINLSDVKKGSLATISEVQLTIDGENTTFLEHCNCNKIDLRLGIDSAGEFYLITKDDGKI